MLAILFIGARMHALQIDPKLDSLQRWAQVCFYGCIASVCVQTLSAILIPFCVECECKEGPSEGELVFVMTNQTLAAVVNSIRHLELFGLYGDFNAVVVFVFDLKHLSGASWTPPITITGQFVMNPTVQHDAIHLMFCVHQFANLEILISVIITSDSLQSPPRPLPVHDQAQ